MDDLTGPPTTTVASCDPQVELQLPDAIAVLKGSNNKKPGSSRTDTPCTARRCFGTKVYIS